MTEEETRRMIYYQVQPIAGPIGTVYPSPSLASAAAAAAASVVAQVRLRLHRSPISSSGDNAMEIGRDFDVTCRPSPVDRRLLFNNA